MAYSPNALLDSKAFLLTPILHGVSFRFALDFELLRDDVVGRLYLLFELEFSPLILQASFGDCDCLHFSAHL